MYFNIYYRLFVLIRDYGDNSEPRYGAVLLFSILQMLNFPTLLGVLGILLKRIVIVDQPYVSGAIGILIVAANLIAVFGKKRYIKIENKFGSEDENGRKRGRIILATYVLLTLGTLAAVIIYLNYNPITHTGIGDSWN
ncbi:hypothetical protein [uncultured Chitinophaga sp.]|uniref:hypothetical protein n=1 Tax=uncultured Chitinophaga sp. TaxID=339340 RepID=UPI0025D94374|nr:hypothetical protein [uncultured Chitinophaga sp.]